MTSRDPAIDYAAWGVARLPLTHPYSLSIGTLYAFESVWVYLSDDTGRCGIGECVPLPGYSWETTQECLASIAGILEGAVTRSTRSVLTECRERAASAPFAMAALASALEFRDWTTDRTTGFPAGYPVASNWGAAKLETEIRAAARGGYRFIKAKIGFDAVQDASALLQMLDLATTHDLHVSCDANQGFTRDEAIEFCRRVMEDHPAPSRLLWLEQPLAASDWSGHRALVEAFGDSMPLYLDESITDDESIRKARESGAKGVKFKLFKSGSASRCAEQINLAQRAGLDVILGNGVSGPVGNLLEAGLAARFDTAVAPPYEFNGFLKIADPMPGDFLSLHSGNILATKMNTTPDPARQLKDWYAEHSADVWVRGRAPEEEGMNP